MVVIMILSMVVANIYRVGYGKPEGFENSDEAEKEEEGGEEEDLEEQFNTALKELEELAIEEDEKEEEEEDKKEGFKNKGVGVGKLVKLGKDIASLEKRMDAVEKIKNK
jgi:Tfp pilus assembly protein PilO